MSKHLTARALRLLAVVGFFACVLWIAGGAARADAQAPVGADMPRGSLSYTIFVPNQPGEMVLVRYPDGRVEEHGRVRVVPQKTKYPGFTASAYGGAGQVVASAANAHHILVSKEAKEEGGKTRTISLFPTATFVAASGLGSSFVVEGVGGVGLWGRLAPYVGSEVFIINPAGVRVPLTHSSLLAHMKALEIDVYAPLPAVQFLQVENKVGGRAWYQDFEGNVRTFAVVEKPVTGTGRFAGTLYQGASMVRANHLGVLCVSTCDQGEIGGFQIVPVTHTYSKEMQKFRTRGQWLVLRGEQFEDLTGRFPFFWGAVRPGDRTAPNSKSGRVEALVKGHWQPLPKLKEVTEGTLANVEAFRITLDD